ncbi:MAG: hypothetical protein N4J56_008012 [Chroococcidiopsis sp. SAG 2025]|uniref:hypothetical protein n=1 Tax=Chroococcidiopsis sp. SAG 2025 TaxID=171389 RepID=UPI0029371CB0|nr:hypothetical protein [Chroococcidiopsis sp. SAG 2025]MDV2998307.1 hypothetical protein [Chroococcidiopsis sp. SAG 2025]
MLKKNLLLGYLGLTFAVILANLTASTTVAQQASEASMSEDDLDTINGLPWAGKKWPFSKVTNIQDSLAGTVLGRVVIDRHGVDKSNQKLVNSNQGSTNLFNLTGRFIKVERPFSAPFPGRVVYVSLWGSNTRGCFAELISQYATAGDLDKEAVAQVIIPEKLEMLVNKKVVELSPQPVTAEKQFSGNYTYSADDGGSKQTGTMYMARNLFAIDSNVANLLSSAQPGQVKARITMKNDEREVFPIGEDTVSRWKYTYGFNPSCKPM